MVQRSIPLFPLLSSLLLPVLWLLWCFLAPAGIKSGKGGVGRADVSARQGKMGFFGKSQSILSPQNENQGCLGARDASHELFLGKGPGIRCFVH